MKNPDFLRRNFHMGQSKEVMRAAQKTPERLTAIQEDTESGKFQDEEVRIQNYLERLEGVLNPEPFEITKEDGERLV